MSNEMEVDMTDSLRGRSEGGTTPTCAGCETSLPTDSHPRRKWCSSRCRKAQYATPCIDCGALTSGSEGRREGARCKTCNARRSRQLNAEIGGARRRARWPEIAADYRAGVPIAQIAARHGLAGAAALSRELFDMRKAGYDLPHRYRAYRAEA